MKANTNILAITDEISVLNYLDYRAYLEDIYTIRKKSQGRYSYSQLAEDLGFSHSNVLYLIIKGKRSMSEKSAQTIAQTLKLAGLQKSYFTHLVRYQNARKSEERDELFQKLTYLKSSSLTCNGLRDQLAFFSEWYHSAIYEAIGLKDFQNDPEWIANHLQGRVSLDKVMHSLKLLEDMGLTRLDPKTQKLVRTQTRISTPAEVIDFAYAMFHKKMIEIGKASIFQVHEDERDIGAVTVAIPESLMPKLKKEIDSFQEKVLAIADQCREADSVYQLNLQLFPLIKAQK